ncbi:insulin-degrading enzyme, putative, partial [Ichthyophthirius multifiliis]
KELLLKNKMQCLLIYDHDTEKSGAALNVKAGFYQDPAETPGLAHFLEHMLFMGTQKYPNQSEYSDYLQKNSGFSNAYTSGNETNYYFTSSCNSIEGALDRFSQFFISPLFFESCVEREMKAVDSEHQKNLNQDNWRMHQLFRFSSLENSEYRKFGTGNLMSLNKEKIREELIEFYEKNYSANLMKLVVYSNSELDIMEKWVQDKFESVKNKDLEGLKKFSCESFNKENLNGNIWKIVPVQNNHCLQIKWILDNMQGLYKNNPLNYLSHVFGHEGKGSLLQILSDLHLASEISCSNGNEVGSFSFLQINIDLSDQGVEKYEEVLKIVFEYVKMVKNKGIQKWVFEEKKLLSELNFENKDKEKPQNYLQVLSSRMQNQPIEDVLIQPYLNEKFEEEVFQKTVDNLNIENMRIQVISQNFKNECILQEPVYNTKYTIQYLPDYLRNFFNENNFNINMQFLEKNQFLPKNMNLFQIQNRENNIPLNVIKNKQSEIWFKEDFLFKKPKAVISGRILLKENIQRPVQRSVFFALYIMLLNDNLRTFRYNAEMAYLGCSVDYQTVPLVQMLVVIMIAWKLFQSVYVKKQPSFNVWIRKSSIFNIRNYSNLIRIYKKHSLIYQQDSLLKGSCKLMGLIQMNSNKLQFRTFHLRSFWSSKRIFLNLLDLNGWLLEIYKRKKSFRAFWNAKSNFKGIFWMKKTYFQFEQQNQYKEKLIFMKKNQIRKKPIVVFKFIGNIRRKILGTQLFVIQFKLL